MSFLLSIDYGVQTKTGSETHASNNLSFREFENNLWIASFFFSDKRHTKITAETITKDFRIIINTTYHKISNQFRDLVQQIKMK